MNTQKTKIKRVVNGSLKSLFNSRKAVNAFTKHITNNPGNLNLGFELIADTLKVSKYSVRAAWYGLAKYKDAKVCRDNIGTLFTCSSVKETGVNRKKF